jgi:hypothetical protein
MLGDVTSPQEHLGRLGCPAAAVTLGSAARSWAACFRDYVSKGLAARAAKHPIVLAHTAVAADELRRIEVLFLNLQDICRRIGLAAGSGHFSPGS